MSGLRACAGGTQGKGCPLSLSGLDKQHCKSETILKLRDTEALFDEVKEKGNIGIPCFQLEDGTLTLDLEEVLRRVLK